VASGAARVDRLRRPGRRQQYPAGHRAGRQPRRHLADARPSRLHRPPGPDHRGDGIREQRPGRPGRRRVNTGVHQQHREVPPHHLCPPAEPAKPSPHRFHRPPQPLSNRPDPRTGRLRGQRRPDHLCHIRPPDQREHRKEHMRHAATDTPGPPRSHHHRSTRHVPQYTATCPAPPAQQPVTTRTCQLAVSQTHLDPRRVGLYREHSASARYTALPALGQRYREGLSHAPPSARCRPKSAPIRRQARLPILSAPSCPNCRTHRHFQ